ncbi:MAG TPA: hypothetical protein VEJ44_04545, partial [Acidimicrobiales bacterium]|nr:hypothetical protein [Acidimicrobiales bacterium]
MDRDRRRPRLLGPHRRSVSTLGTGARCVVLAVAIGAASFPTDAGAAGAHTTARSTHTSSTLTSSVTAS